MFHKSFLLAGFWVSVFFADFCLKFSGILEAHISFSIDLFPFCFIIRLHIGPFTCFFIRLIVPKFFPSSSFCWALLRFWKNFTKNPVTIIKMTSQFEVFAVMYRPRLGKAQWTPWFFGILVAYRSYSLDLFFPCCFITGVTLWSLFLFLYRLCAVLCGLNP